jgi:hypothetical protein
VVKATGETPKLGGALDPTENIKFLEITSLSDLWNSAWTDEKIK